MGVTHGCHVHTSTLVDLSPGIGPIDNCVNVYVAPIQWIGDVYAGAVLEKLPDTPDDWSNIYFLRKLSKSQLEDARALGVKMAEAIKAGGLTPATLDNLVGPIGRGVARIINRVSPPYQTV